MHGASLFSLKHYICDLVAEIGTPHVPAICQSLTASFLYSVAALVLIEVSEEIVYLSCRFVTRMNQFYHSSRTSTETVLTALFLIAKSLFVFLHTDSHATNHKITLFKI